MTLPNETITQLRAACAAGEEALEIDRRVRVAAIRARLTAASTGHWFRKNQDTGQIDVLCHTSTSTAYRIATVLRRGRRPQQDADLIAHAPADLGWLLDESDRLRAERDLLLKNADEQTTIAYWTLRAARRQQEVQDAQAARAAR